MAFTTQNDLKTNNSDEKLSSRRRRRRRPYLLIVFFSLMVFYPSLASVATCISMHNQNNEGQQQEHREQPKTEDRENQQFLHELRIKALYNLQRSLESLSSLTINSLMMNAALQTPLSSSNELFQSFEDNDELEENMKQQQQEYDVEEDDPQQQRQAKHLATNSDFPQNAQHLLQTSQFSMASSQRNEILTTTTTAGSSSKQQTKGGIRRIRADLREIPLSPPDGENVVSTTVTENNQGPRIKTITSDDDSPGLIHIIRRSTKIKNRQMRSAISRHGFGHGHHRRRRKGCPSVHSKDQLFCPTRNTHHYDVCITREQLCDRVRDCPGGEDEDPRHCFFFRPLETSLKTISHAVLLLVDTVMREQEKQQQQQQRNEL